MTHTNVEPPASAPIRVGLIGAGGIGSFHGESLAWRIPGATLAAVADPARETAERVASSLDCPYATPDPAQVLKDPSIQAVVIAAPPSVHADLIEAAAGVGKAVFCEKPMAVTLANADRAIEAASAARVPLQVGFNRRFAPDFRAAHDLVVSGDVGQPHLLRSLTRDPELEDPSVVKPWTIFLETLIHDFDTLLWLNPGARVVEVYAMADALVRPDWKDRGLLDTAVGLVRFDNGAMATAEDTRRTSMTFFGEKGEVYGTVRRNIDLFRDAYTGELAHFVDCVRNGTRPECTGEDARKALATALTAIRSVEAGRPVRLDELEDR